MRGNKENPTVLNADGLRTSFRADVGLGDKIALLEILWNCKKSKAIETAIVEAYDNHFMPLLGYAMDNVKLSSDGSIQNSDVVRNALIGDYGCNAEIAVQAVDKAARKLRYKLVKNR